MDELIGMKSKDCHIHPDWSGKKIVRGHRIVEEPWEYQNYIDLDTGCYEEEGQLTVGILNEGEATSRGIQILVCDLV